ncbi:Crp/Fnr family transcriptional regulator [Pseudoramibacter sp.]|jgi:CRP-like cAMP-binding protein|uniref:Crp/Fnr family transcriptional regulator n=1 Tax=Pseudoramibacter sp. TaxID=2034862 RepID=UPI0025F33565|nr:Crp/Fnr family transcriptional regulator [Pseudoramibacter sp.]MCH4072777.1 Crp/Fnr family transcriptional regulator [Pseudoramibacter sp.]MCH4106548.1 Crp/Fnr family transcriptional regulator [Pseudoramibacter sp.]
MKVNFELLTHINIFNHMNADEISALLNYLNYRTQTFQRKTTICCAGDYTSEFGIILNGEASIENIDFWGNVSIIAHLSAGSIFAESYAITREALAVDVIAQKKCQVLFISLNNIFDSDNIHDPLVLSGQKKLVHNLLILCSKKNLHLSHRIFHTSSKTIRGRVISYLSFLSKEKKCADFNIPFNRQQLADYLNVDRSALSHELSKMQKEGLILIDKNHFSLKEKVM